ncbi:ERDJ2 [Symbiodinium sp. CCMP2456]|nr:ERDJ2 [Symbiodinium sp. CCMP2456]
MSFKDTFTKDDQKEGLLGYDDTAFYYFFSSVLVTVAVPWTCSVIYNFLFPGQAQVEKDFPTKSKSGSRYHYCQSSQMVDKIEKARQKARRASAGSSFTMIIKLSLLAGIWLTIYLIHLHLGDAKEIKRFDPFEILEVSPGASAPEVKKAYRQLSLKYHPDKNPDDPLAASRFMQITKAHNALTDETAKANYEKYGNPDGPQTSKVGIGLPRFLLEKENHLMILCLFFFLLLFVVPMAFICYYQRTKNYAANGVMIETLQFMGYYINEATRLKNCPELLAASAESRGMSLRPSDNAEMKTLSAQVVEHKKRQFTAPIIIKNNFLLLGHMQRLHHLMSDDLRADLDEMLRHSQKITQAMIEIACMREWFFTAQAMIEFRRSLIQALDVKSSQLLQIPHFNEEILKHCLKGKNATSTLLDYLQKDRDQRKGLTTMSPDQVADVEAFTAHVSNMELKAITEVEDEKDIVVGDIATVTCQLTRKNLQEGEAMGPVHAPFYPEPKFEEWWIFLVEGAPNTRIMGFERIRDTDRVVETKLRFQVSRPGKHSLTVHALCDSYVGIDQKVDLNFVVHTEEEVKREIFVHPEDEDLDLQPTLFQQFMGEPAPESLLVGTRPDRLQIPVSERLGGDDESEEEEDDDKNKGKSKVEKLSDGKQQKACCPLSRACATRAVVCIMRIRRRGRIAIPVVAILTVTRCEMQGLEPRPSFCDVNRRSTLRTSVVPELLGSRVDWLGRLSQLVRPMSQVHMSDSVFCHRHRWKVGLLHVIDDAWKAQALPEDDLVLPEGHQINLDESDDKTPEMERSEERWCELPLTHFLEEEAEVAVDRGASSF